MTRCKPCLIRARGERPCGSPRGANKNRSSATSIYDSATSADWRGQDRIGPSLGSPIAEDELRARLNLVQPGTRLSKQIIVRNADEIQIYLRDRGYFNATVEPTEEVDSSGTRAIVTYRITPGEQSRVDAFNIDITGFDVAKLRRSLKLAIRFVLHARGLG